MVKFSDAILTNLGEQMFLKATVEHPINFTHLTFSADFIKQEDIKNLTIMGSMQDISISQVELEEECIKISALFSNTGLDEGYYLRAIGLYADNVLIAVSLEDSGSCYIESENTSPVGAIIQMFLKSTDAKNINLTINPLGSATLSDVKEVENLITTHIENKSNPHNITKETLGLGNVENVSVNNQTPTFSEAASLENIANGEKNSTLWGKVAKAISSLITHITNLTVHITSDERTKWNTVSGKVDAVTGKGLSTNDYTTEEKNKLAGIAAGAQVNTITGVKGNAETGYRTGNVNITPANIGLGNVDNTADVNKSVNYATTASNADTVDGHRFNWSGQTGQPMWVWGGNEPENMYVYNPSNFNVNYATSAGSAGNVSWNNISSKPSTFTPSTHIHDDRYYTETEVNNLINGRLVQNGDYFMTGEGNMYEKCASGSWVHWVRYGRVCCIQYCFNLQNLTSGEQLVADCFPDAAVDAYGFTSQDGNDKSNAYVRIDGNGALYANANTGEGNPANRTVRGSVTYITA